MMSDGAGKEGDGTPKRTRRSAKTLRGNKRTPAPGKRFPSEVFGDNVRLLRQTRRLYQKDLAELMNLLGFPGWSYVTVSDVERGRRSTSVDELYALATALKTYVVKLLDPDFSGNQGPDIDLGFPPIEGWEEPDARTFIMSAEDPWQVERGDLPYATFQRKLRHLAYQAEDGGL
ncbi:MAG: helix-turn-helix domain-containing protein [Thermoleophilia bacterium]